MRLNVCLQECTTRDELEEDLQVQIAALRWTWSHWRGRIKATSTSNTDEAPNPVREPPTSPITRTTGSGGSGGGRATIID